MKKRMVMVLMITGMALTGCQKNSISADTGLTNPEPAEETEAEEEEATEETESAEEAAEEASDGEEETAEADFGENGTISIQTLFDYNRDGEAHEVQYYQDLANDYIGYWRCVSRPDLGVESVPLMGDELSDPNVETVTLDDLESLDEYDPNGHEVIDLSTVDNVPDNTFIHWMFSDGLVGIFEQEIEYDGDLPTSSEVMDSLNRYGIYPDEQVYEDTNDDGDTIYSGYCKFEYNEDFKYYGAYCFRVEDGNAQGAFSMFRNEENSGNVIGILPYMVQGIKFVH